MISLVAQKGQKIYLKIVEFLPSEGLPSSQTSLDVGKDDIIGGAKE